MEKEQYIMIPTKAISWKKKLLHWLGYLLICPFILLLLGLAVLFVMSIRLRMIWGFYDTTSRYLP